MIGARSALFLPFPELGLIVVDEERDAQLQAGRPAVPGPRPAVARARFEICPALLVSATPALDTAWLGRIAARGRPGAAASALLLPARPAARRCRGRLLDLRRERPPRGGWLAPRLRAALTRSRPGSRRFCSPTGAALRR